MIGDGAELQLESAIGLNTHKYIYLCSIPLEIDMMMLPKVGLYMICFKNRCGVLGIGLASLGNSQVFGAHLHSEYCWASNNLLASMVTEAKKSGPDGFDFRKEVTVFEYNSPVELPVPSHDNCQIEVSWL